MGGRTNDPSENSQAWRKKPRNFAPKSRSGCRTCKIRRVKCDLARPSCLRCSSTGRTCDGYTERAAIQPAPSQTHHRAIIALRPERRGTSNHSSSMSAYEPKRLNSRCNGHILRNLGSFMILPEIVPGQAEAMAFFEGVSVRHLNEHRPCESWRNTVMLFSQTVPPVRHAALALAMMHRNHMDCYDGDRVYQQAPKEDCLQYEASLLHYNRAIQLLLSPDDGDSPEWTVVTLLVSYLFTCFDHLVGQDVQAFEHLRAGVALSRDIENDTLNNSIHDGQHNPGPHTIISQITEQIRRLDMQAGMFLVDWEPDNARETTMSNFARSVNAFHSLDQAADTLQVLVTQVMRLRSTEQQLSPMGTMPPLPYSPKQIILDKLETWSSLFENLLEQQNQSKYTDGAESLIPLLRLQHTVIMIFLSSYGYGGEMEYDHFLPQFKRCIPLANMVAAAHQRYSGSLQWTFTPNVGLIPALYIIGAKCRDPLLRREVVTILRQQLIREASWDSISTALIVERIIEIEESGPGGCQTVQSMEQILAGRRIEALSYGRIQTMHSPARLEITYTFCGREGIHTESLAAKKSLSDRVL